MWRSTAPAGRTIDEISWKERVRGKNPWSVCAQQPTCTNCRMVQEALNQEPLVKEWRGETSETSILRFINVSSYCVLLPKSCFSVLGRCLTLHIILRDHSQLVDVLTHMARMLYKEWTQHISVVYIYLLLLYNCVTHKLAFVTFLEEKSGIWGKKKELSGAEGEQFRGVIKN